MSLSEQHNSLSNDERLVLKKLLLDSPRRPGEYTFDMIYKLFDYEKYTEKYVYDLVLSLVERGYLEEKSRIYFLSRNIFSQLKKKYKLQILFKSQYAIMFTPILVGFIVAAISSLIEKNGLFESDKSKRTEEHPIEYRVNILEGKLDSLNKISNSNSKNQDSAFDRNTMVAIQQQYYTLSENVKSLNSLLQENPTKFIEIATIKRDIENIKQQVTSNNDSLKRDIDRISSYNNTLIVFMITFLVAYIGIGVFNIINRTKSNSI